MQYIKTDSNGNIAMLAEWQFEDSVPADKHVVTGWDGRFYVEGDPRIEKPADLALEEARTARLADVSARYEAALIATLTMPESAMPGTADIALASLDFARDDPEGLADVRTILASRRDALRSAVRAAKTAAEVESVIVDYPV